MVDGTLGNFKHLVLDEIALEGLEGVTINSLWINLATSLKCTTPLPKVTQDAAWRCIQQSEKHLLFYELPQARATITPFDRYAEVDSILGVPIVPKSIQKENALFVPIDDNGVYGSCSTYTERKPINYQDISEMSVDDVLQRWENKFVIVGTQQLRFDALTPLDVLKPTEINAQYYCFWEAIGRGRFNGQTTSGAHSVAQNCKDGTIMFYIKNKFTAAGLVTSRPYIEMLNGRTNITSLMTLPRFYTPDRSTLTTVVRQLHDMLQEQPEHVMPLYIAKQCLPYLCRVKAFKRICMTQMFRVLFEIRPPTANEVDLFRNTTRYFGIEPEEKEDKPPAKKKKSKNENGETFKNRLVILLRQPHLKLEEIFTQSQNARDEENADENNAEDSDDSASENNGHMYVDMPLNEVVYRAVWRHGRHGISQTHLCQYLKVHKLAIRHILKIFLRAKLMKCYYTDCGRQRNYMYVACEYAHLVDDGKNMIQLENIKCENEPIVPATQKRVPADIPEVEAVIEPFTDKDIVRVYRNRTIRDKMRKLAILKTINERVITSQYDCWTMVQQQEKDAGYKDEMCNKSLKRLMREMEDENLLKCFIITLKIGENTRILRYLTHPKIHPQHRLMQDEVLRVKHTFYSQLQERRLRERVAELERQKKVEQKLEKQKKVRAQLIEDGRIKVRHEFLRGAAAHKPPKFLISRSMHEFLYYIVVELNSCQTPVELNADLLENWQNTAPDIEVQKFFELEKSPPLCYNKTELNWTTFIPPLPHYADKPAGWFYIPDALERLPLSILNKIFRLNKEMNEAIYSYIMHPVRQHYLLSQLPVNIQFCISRSYQQQVYGVMLKLLNHMGLLQVKHSRPLKIGKDVLNMWAYLNRYVRIKDTTTTNERYEQIEADRNYDMIYFTFKTTADINRYWANLHRVCLYTKLGFRSQGGGVVQKQNKREKELEFLSSVDFDAAPALDNAQTPGDGLGAAGLSSNLRSHIFRSWCWVTASVSKLSKPLVRQQMRTSRAWQPLRKSRQSLISNANIKSLSQTKKRARVPKPRAPRVKPRDAIDHDALKNMRTIRGKWHPEEDQILKLGRAVYIYLAPSTHVLGLLSMGKVTRDIIRHSLGICNKTIIACVRRIKFLERMERHVPQVPTWLNMLQTNDYMQRVYGEKFIPQMQEIYKKSKQELIRALETHFMLIMHIIFEWAFGEQMTTVTASETKSWQFQLPNSLTEFAEKFQIRALNINNIIEAKSIGAKSNQKISNQLNPVHENPKTLADLKIKQVIAVLHSMLSCTHDKSSYNLQAFEIFKNFSEDVLHTAFAKARADGLVIPTKRKTMGLEPRQLAAPSYVLCNKYRIRLMYLKFPYNIYDKMYGFGQQILQNCLSTDASESGNASNTLDDQISLSNRIFELTSPTAGQFLWLSESLSTQLWQICIKLPANILTVDPEQHQSVHTFERIINQHQAIFEHAPRTEYAKNLEEGSNNENKVRVKFNRANLSYKVYYSPWDYISKLHAYQLHFFCALDAMYQEVHINFAQLQKLDFHKDDVDIADDKTVSTRLSDGEKTSFLIPVCPFKSCILQKCNYLDEIERIVRERRAIINKINPDDDNEQILVNEQTTIKVQPTNVLNLSKMLETYWQEKLCDMERKDIGKISAHLRRASIVATEMKYSMAATACIKSITDRERVKELNWLNLCKEIADYNFNEDDVNKTEEFEPTLNKEDRLSRVQDVFVINLPTLQVCASAKLHDMPKQSVTKTLPNIVLPDYFLETDRQRDAILLKVMNESLWKYTENTLHTLLEKLPPDEFNEMEKQHLQEILDYIGEKSLGADILDLLQVFPYEKFLIRALNLLSEHWLIKRVGMATRLYVHKEKIRPWLVHTFHIKRLQAESLDTRKSRKRKHEPTASSSKKAKPTAEHAANDSSDTDNEESTAEAVRKDVIVMRPQPWIRLNGSLNRRVLDRWLGSILIECVNRNGMLVTEVCNRFPHMPPVDIMFLLELLNDMKCLQLKEISTVGAKPLSLTCSYEELNEIDVYLLYDPARTYVHVTQDALTRMANFIGQKKYKVEFI